MILYHFTDLYALQNAGPDAILAAGLRARDPNEDYPMFAGKLRPCVWFTSKPELPQSMMTASAQEVRITVELSTVSKRLVSWQKLLRRANRYSPRTGHIYSGVDYFRDMERDKSLSETIGREATADEFQAWRYWWVHFGDVPLKAIRAVEQISKTNQKGE